MADIHANFAYSTITGTTTNNGTNPGTTGSTITVGLKQGLLFPSPPFNATVWPTATQPTSANAEIVRVTAIVDDTFTLDSTSGTRNQQESSSARNIIVGDQIAATITAKTLTDAETPLTNYSPYVLASGAASGLQTLAANFTSVTSTGSLFVFPVTVPQSLQFNQLLLGQSLSMVTANVAAASHSYASKFGIYSMNANTLSLITSNSFGISEVMNVSTASWTYPNTTATSGYGYASSTFAGTGSMSSYISGSRIVGLQFASNMTLSGGVYWIGIMSQRTTGDTRSTNGLSHAGIVGHIIAPHNQVGTVSGVLPIGLAATDWGAAGKQSHVTGWWGRHIIGFISATTIGNFGGSAIPTAITLSELAGVAANSTVTILPTVTFVST